MRSSRRYAASAALLALLALLSCRGLANQQGGIRLISDAKSSYRIRLIPGSTESDLTAASELQRYITEISGVKIPIIGPDVFPRTGHIDREFIEQNEQIAACRLGQA